MKYTAGKFNSSKWTETTQIRVFICGVCHQTSEHTHIEGVEEVIDPSPSAALPLCLSTALPPVPSSLTPQLSFLRLSWRNPATESVKSDRCTMDRTPCLLQ